MFDLFPSKLDGCFIINVPVFNDSRGKFVKIFDSSQFEKATFETIFREQFYSISHHGVIRGLHFQSPPYDHVKVVHCIAGEILDVVVDLRLGSSTYGSFEQFSLSGDIPKLVYIPKGMAHGFCVLSESATVAYSQSTLHTKTHDHGIRWDSVGITWPIASPIVSVRDRSFPTIDEFRSPFMYEQQRT